MIILDFGFVLVITLFLTAIFAVGFRGQRPGMALLSFFIILFLATWAGGIWITPIGSPLWGISWLSFLLVCLLLVLLLTALIPASVPYTRRAAAAQQREETETVTTIFGIFFWILVIGLIVAIILYYV